MTTNSQVQQHNSIAKLFLLWFIVFIQTTAVAMAWCLLVLADNPEIQTKAREEILSVFPKSDTEVTWERLEELHYCNCIVKETLR